MQWCDCTKGDRRWRPNRSRRAGCREATLRQQSKTTRTRTRTRHNAEDRAKIEETSVEKVRHNDPRSREKLGKSSPKSTENRLRSDLGRFEPIRVVQGSATDAPKTAQERSETRLERPKSALGSVRPPQDAPQNALRPPLGRSCGARKQRRSAIAASNPGKSDRKTNFDRFSRVARQR